MTAVTIQRIPTFPRAVIRHDSIAEGVVEVLCDPIEDDVVQLQNLFQNASAPLFFLKYTGFVREKQESVCKFFAR